MGLQSARMRYQASRFSDVFRPPGLPAVRSPLMTANAIDEVFPTTERECERSFEGPFSEVERGLFDALHAQDAHPNDAGSALDGNAGDSSSLSSSCDDEGARKRNNKKMKNGLKNPYKVKNAKMRLP